MREYLISLWCVIESCLCAEIICPSRTNPLTGKQRSCITKLIRRRNLAKAGKENWAGGNSGSVFYFSQIDSFPQYLTNLFTIAITAHCRGFLFVEKGQNDRI